MKKKHIWDLRFLTLAKTVSTWSKDPSTKVGAVIVDKNRRVVSLGYNGFPKGVKDTIEKLEDREQKYKHMVHAERNAMLFANKSLKGCTI
jgi:dCMP deaminase